MPDDAGEALQHVYSLLGAEGVGSQVARQVEPPDPNPLIWAAPHAAPQHFHTGFTDVQKESAVARGEDGMVNIGSSSMQW